MCLLNEVTQRKRWKERHKRLNKSIEQRELLIQALEEYLFELERFINDEERRNRVSEGRTGKDYS